MQGLGFKSGVLTMAQVRTHLRVHFEVWEGFDVQMRHTLAPWSLGVGDFS